MNIIKALNKMNAELLVKKYRNTVKKISIHRQDAQ